MASYNKQIGEHNSNHISNITQITLGTRCYNFLAHETRLRTYYLPTQAMKWLSGVFTEIKNQILSISEIYILGHAWELKYAKLWASLSFETSTDACSREVRDSLHTSQISHLLLNPSLWLLIPGSSSQFLPLFPSQPAFEISTDH